MGISYSNAYSRVGSKILKSNRASLVNTKLSKQSSDRNNITTTAKGFGVPKQENISLQKDAGTITYESQAKRGVPEYNIFLRPSNGTDEEWVAVGPMTIPRNVNIASAVYEVEQEILNGTFKLYPKLKTYFQMQRAMAQGKSTDEIFEYGYCLKAFPDEPITLVTKANTKEEKPNFFMDW